MHTTQLSAYSRNVPKFDDNSTVNKLLGSFAIVSCDMYPKLDQNPCGSALMAASVIAPASPNSTDTPKHPNTAATAANVHMARCGLSVLPCSRPKCSGTSSSLPIAYVT